MTARMALARVVCGAMAVVAGVGVAAGDDTARTYVVRYVDVAP